jgi:hypothetical protein
MVQKKATTWRRRAAAFKDNDDLPRVDEQWLQRTCRPVEVYREVHKGGFREEWRLVPGLAELIGKARDSANQDTHIVLSEVVLEFIPVTEIVFDLGDRHARKPAKTNGKGNGTAPTTESDLYSWHIYGFEQRLPNDWRFLNWARVTAMVLSLALVATLVLLGIMLYNGLS